MSEKYTPEDIAKFTESRAINDAKLIEGGAHYLPTENGEPRLEITKKQLEDLGKQDPNIEHITKGIEKTEILRTFSTPDQTEELDFKEFLSHPLFGDYFRYINKEDSFQSLVYDTSQPFDGIKGRVFQEITPKQEVGERVVKAEHDINPISLNEWRYLVTTLTEEQLLGNTYYFVKLDNGDIRSIKVSLSKGDGGGPYGYSMSIQRLSPRDFYNGPIKPRVISPAE